MLLRRILFAVVVSCGWTFATCFAFAGPPAGSHKPGHGQGQGNGPPGAAGQHPGNSGSAGAKGGHRGPRNDADAKAGHDWKAQMHEKLKKFDANGDGKLEPQERQTAREAWEKHRRREMEKNRAAAESALGGADAPSQQGGTSVSSDAGSPGGSDSGTALSGNRGPSAEKEAQMRRVYHWMLEHFDANANGRLDPAEVQQVREAFHGREARENGREARENGREAREHGRETRERRAGESHTAQHHSGESHGTPHTAAHGSGGAVR